MNYLRKVQAPDMELLKTEACSALARISEPMSIVDLCFYLNNQFNITNSEFRVMIDQVIKVVNELEIERRIKTEDHYFDTFILPK